MPRFLRRNVRMTGVSLSPSRTGNKALGFGREHPGWLPGFIVPQVIEWPWSEDEAGVAFPAGLVGVRCRAEVRSLESLWATSGHDYEDQDRWIAVPDTLPSGYTARRTRDCNKGGTYEGGAGGDPDPIYTRGAPYLNVTHNEQEDVFGGIMLANWIANSGAPHGGNDAGPAYRPEGGGGVVPLTWYPANVSDRTLHFRIGGVSFDPANFDAWFATAGISPVQYNAAWTNVSLGFRAMKMRATVQASAAAWAALANTDIGVQFAVRTNADRNSTAGDGDTAVYLSALFRKSDFSPVYAVGGTNYYSITHEFDFTPYNPTPSEGSTHWCAGYILEAVNLSGVSDWDPSDPAEYQYSKRVDMCSRVDIPLWFTATGIGLIAPGGLPT